MVQPFPLMGQTMNWFPCKTTQWNIQHKVFCSLDVNYKLQFYWDVPVGWLRHVRLHVLCFVWRKKLPQVRRKLSDMGHMLVYQNLYKIKKKKKPKYIFPKLSEGKHREEQQQQ